MLEASVLEPIPLVPQRRRATAPIAPQPASRFFPKAPVRPVEDDESVTRELPPSTSLSGSDLEIVSIEAPEPIAPVSFEVIDDRAIERIDVALEPVRWMPLQSPPTDGALARRRRASMIAWLIFAALCVVIALARVLRS
jgi:hypothetical protein